MGVGGVSITAPRTATPWNGSFGVAPLCADPKIDGTVRVTGFREVKTVGEIGELEALLAVPQASTRPATLLFGSALGSAPDFSEPYADKHGAEATYDMTPLSEKPELRPCTGKVEEDSGLVVSFSTGRTGAEVSEWEVLYEVDGQKFVSEPVHWEMTLCGTDPGLQRNCSG